MSKRSKREYMILHPKRKKRKTHHPESILEKAKLLYFYPLNFSKPESKNFLKDLGTYLTNKELYIKTKKFEIGDWVLFRDQKIRLVSKSFDTAFENMKDYELILKVGSEFITQEVEEWEMLYRDCEETLGN